MLFADEKSGSDQDIGSGTGTGSDPKPMKQISKVTIRFAGDSGDGMQLTGSQFTDTTALMGNDISTLPDFPAEIRAPIGTLPGVSSYQIQFSDTEVHTPGDESDVLVAMNPAALKVNIPFIRKGGLIIVNEDAFTEGNLKKANYASHPLKDGTLSGFQVICVPLSMLVKKALQDTSLKLTEIERAKNFLALGITFWMYDRKLDHTVRWIQKKFQKRPEIVDGNVRALKAGYNYAEMTEAIPTRYEIQAAPITPGTYRKISGNEAAAIGLITAAQLAKKTLLYASYPITPASDILHEMARRKHYGVKTFQAEDEIAACGVALGASYGGQIGVTASSGPGICLKAEMMGLAVATELPLIVLNVQRAGPSTGMPTKPEQADLLQAFFGRNGESPIVILAPSTPADCFQMAIEAVRIALVYMMPVVYLSDGYLASSSEPWKLPDLSQLPKIEVTHPKPIKEKFFPFLRNQKTLARPWAVPGTPGLEHRIGGLSKADVTGNVSYDPDNNQRMVDIRAEKVQRVAQDIPNLKVRGPKSGQILVLGWGSTYGAIYQAVTDLQNRGVKVSQAHLRYLSPYPKNLKDVLARFEKIVIPEMNMGQLLLLIRGAFPGTDAVGIHKVQGQPFKVKEIVNRILELV